MKIGDVRVEVVSDGTFWLDAGGHFGLVPKTLWQKVAEVDDLNRVPLSLNCLYIESDGKRIIIDTGLGTKLSEKARQTYNRDEKGGLLGSLAKIGVTPEDIDLVIDTHLHSDHCGGNTRREGERIVPTFPRAEYWVQRREFEDASQPNERTRATYHLENYLPLKESGQLRLLSGDTKVTSQVRTMMTRGHTPGHQSVVIESKGEMGIYLADLAPWAVHFERLAWIPAYDLEPLVTLETKRLVQQMAFEKGALLFIEHDPKVAAGYLQRHGEEYKIEAVAVEVAAATK